LLSVIRFPIRPLLTSILIISMLIKREAADLRPAPGRVQIGAGPEGP